MKKGIIIAILAFIGGIIFLVGGDYISCVMDNGVKACYFEPYLGNE